MKRKPRLTRKERPRLILTKERRAQMVRVWLRDNHKNMKPGEAVVMTEDGNISALPQQKVAEILAADPEHFAAMAEGAKKKPGEGDVPVGSVFIVIFSRTDGWSGWASPSEVGGVHDETQP